MTGYVRSRTDTGTSGAALARTQTCTKGERRVPGGEDLAEVLLTLMQIKTVPSHWWPRSLKQVANPLLHKLYNLH